MAAKLLGYRLQRKDGIREDEDPFGLLPFEVMVGPAAKTAKAWVEDHDDYELVEVRYGDIVRPNLVNFVVPKTVDTTVAYRL